MPSNVVLCLYHIEPLSLSFISNLDGNGLTSLPSTVFQGLAELTDLNLNNNAFTTLPSGIFTGLSTLISLYVHVAFCFTLVVILVHAIHRLKLHPI